jgi:hypothetical protein
MHSLLSCIQVKLSPSVQRRKHFKIACRNFIKMVYFMVPLECGAALSDEKFPTFRRNVFLHSQRSSGKLAPWQRRYCLPSKIQRHIPEDQHPQFRSLPLKTACKICGLKSFVVLIHTHKARVANALPASLCYTVRCHIFKIMEITQLEFYFFRGGRGAANQPTIMKVVLCRIELQRLCYKVLLPLWFLQH